MQSLHRGDIVIVAFPYTDLSMQKRRPALVVNEKTEEGDVILAFIGTHLPDNATVTSVILRNFDQDFAAQGSKSIPSFDWINWLQSNAASSPAVLENFLLHKWLP